MKRVQNKEEAAGSFIAWRFNFVIAVILFLIVLLVSRVIYLTLIQQAFLRTEGNARTVRVVDIPAFRGMIVDRNGNSLAVSAEVYSVWVNPQEFSPTSSQWRTLGRQLSVNTAKLQASMAREKNKGREFFYLKRGLEPEMGAKIKKQMIPGVYLQREYKRYYPEAEVTAQLLGFTNIDDRGQEGLELLYNEWLQGVPGKKVVIRDRLGHVISDVKVIQDQKPGKHLILSIDRRIQYLSYRELMYGVQRNAAQSGTAIVLNARTGEVLAMVNYPSFNPNFRHASSPSVYRNNAVTDVFEPGSTIKAFSAACALDSGKYKPNTLIDTFPGWLRVGHNVVHDDKNLGMITLTQVIQLSSDVGTTKMILSLPPQQLWNLLHRVGFGEPTGVEFPGEQTGVLVNHPLWSPFVLATLSFGYGMSVTPLQLARAYAVFANDGVKLPVTVLRRDKPVVGEQVIEPRITQQMLTLLESVVAKGGTGAPARIAAYRVAGKTGTARRIGAHGYEKHRYESTFVGIAPVTRPLLVVAVIIHDPLGKYYYGGQVSGPVFARIMEGALRILNIEPDRIG